MWLALLSFGVKTAVSDMAAPATSITLTEMFYENSWGFSDAASNTV